MSSYKDYLRMVINSEPARIVGAMGVGAQDLVGNIGRYGMHTLNRGAQTISGAGDAWNGYFNNNEQKIDDWWDNPPVLPDSYNQYKQGLVEENPMAADAGQIVAGGIAAQPFKMADAYRTGQGPYARMAQGKGGYSKRQNKKEDADWQRYNEQLRKYQARKLAEKMLGTRIKGAKRPEQPGFSKRANSQRNVYGRKIPPSKEPKLDAGGYTKHERAGHNAEFQKVLGESIQNAGGANMVANWVNQAQVHKQLNRERKGQENLQTQFKEAAGESMKYNDHLKEMYKKYKETGDDRYLYDQ